MTIYGYNTWPVEVTRRNSSNTRSTSKARVTEHLCSISQDRELSKPRIDSHNKALYDAPRHKSTPTPNAARHKPMPTRCLVGCVISEEVLLSRLLQSTPCHPIILWRCDVLFRMQLAVSTTHRVTRTTRAAIVASPSFPCRRCDSLRSRIPRIPESNPCITANMLQIDACLLSLEDDRRASFPLRHLRADCRSETLIMNANGDMVI